MGNPDPGKPGSTYAKNYAPLVEASIKEAVDAVKREYKALIDAQNLKIKSLTAQISKLTSSPTSSPPPLPTSVSSPPPALFSHVVLNGSRLKTSSQQETHALNV